MIKTKQRKYKELVPYGILTTNIGKEYWLLHPHSLPPDWENECLFRFSVVPKNPVAFDGNTALFSSERHILVSTGFTIEYELELKPIKIRDVEIGAYNE